MSRAQEKRRCWSCGIVSAHHRCGSSMPKRTAFAPVGEHKPLTEGVSRNPPYLNGETVRRVEGPKPVEAKGQEHGFRVGDVVDDRECPGRPMKVVGLGRRPDFCGADDDSIVWVEDASIGPSLQPDGAYYWYPEALVLISRAAPKPERKIEPGARVRVVSKDFLNGRVGTVIRQSSASRGFWYCYLSHVGDYVLRTNELELVEG